MDVLDEVDDDIVKTIRKNLKDHATAYRTWRMKAKESYDFVASEQWTEEEKSALQESSRTPIVFNRVARTINAVIGLELQNRQEVSYKPVSVQATGINDVMNSAAKWVRSNCDAEDEESEAFFDTLVCGVGATESLIDYTSNLDGMVTIERIDPFECAADSRAKKRNFDDAKWVARWRGYSKQEFKEKWPNANVEGRELLGWNDTPDVETTHADDEYKYGETDTHNNDVCYTVVKYQYYIEENVYRIPMGEELKTLSEGEYLAIQPVLEQQGIKATPQKKKTFKQVLICRDTLLEPETDCPIDGFTIRFITGLRDRNRNIWFGLVELMKDPQRWANKWLSQIQYIINSNAKGGLLYEANSFINPKRAKADWAKPNTWIEVVKGALVEGRIKDRTPPAYPEGIDRLLSQALTAINDVPGVNVEMLGIANRNQPGVIEDSRKDAGVTILASFFDALRRYRKEQGRVLMMFIIGYISDGRLIRIDGANAKYVPLLRAELSENYDILVDDSPTSANMKEKTFNAISSMLGVALQAGIPVPPEVLEYSPLPSQLVEKWMALIQTSKAGDPEKIEMQQTIQKMAEELKIAVNEIANKHGEIEVKSSGDKMKHEAEMTNATIKAYEAETERMKIEAEAKIKEHEVLNPPEVKAPEAKVEAAPQMSEDSMPMDEDMLVSMLQSVREKKVAETQQEEMKMQKEMQEKQEKDSYQIALLQGIQGVQMAVQQLTAAVIQPKQATFAPDGSINVISRVH